jgi:hypothetical protein
VYHKSQTGRANMKRTVFGLGLLVAATILSSSCYAGDECAPAGGLSFICGPEAAEVTDPRE